MVQSYENLSPDMAALVAAGRWTEAEYLEETLVSTSAIPVPRAETQAEDDEETPETHDCPLDIIDTMQREKAIRRGHIAIADEIDSSTLERHALCLRGEGPGIVACTRMLTLLDSDEQSIDSLDDASELY